MTCVSGDPGQRWRRGKKLPELLRYKPCTGVRVQQPVWTLIVFHSTGSGTSNTISAEHKKLMGVNVNGGRRVGQWRDCLLLGHT